MITDQPIDAERPWGAPAPPEPARPMWSGRKTAMALAVAVVIAGGGGAAIYAATANASGNSPGARPGGGGPGGPGGGPGFGPDGAPDRGAGALATALHGEFVVADGSTELLQSGKVTAISASSIALISADGYAKTYTIDASTVVGNGRGQLGDIKTGDQVTVIAKSAGVALTVDDRANLRQGGPIGVPRQPPAAR